MGFILGEPPPSTTLVQGTASGQSLVWNNSSSQWDIGPIITQSSPVYVENYLASSGNDIRLAIIAALAANLTATLFILPPGSWPFIGTITQANGLRNNITFQGQSTQLYRDMAGVASGQIIFFMRSDTGVGTHADRMTFRGIRFTLLNALTSYFGYAVGLESASNCRILDCEFDCTLAVGTTTGRIRWGCGLFGGDQSTDPTAGTNNLIDGVKLTLAQIQGCAAGRSVDGLIINNVEVNQANDLAISVVSSGAFSVQNVTISNVVCHDVGGAGVIFVGSDGAGTGIGAALVRNLTINSISLDGQRNPDLDFAFASALIVDGGIVTENVVINNVCTRLAPNASAQARSITVASQDDETSWTGLSISNCELGVVTSNDPLEPLYISGKNMSGVKLTNIRCRGNRGIRIIDADAMTISNCVFDDGTLLIQASSRDLTAGIAISNCELTRIGGFNASLTFQSTTGRSMSNVVLSNLVLNAAVAGLQTVLGGGTMSMQIANIDSPANANPTAETLTGIVRAVNVKGFFVTTTASVTVPAVAAGSVGYVNVSMAGTRLADLAVGEAVVVNPGADLVAAGVGGGFISARVSAVGTVRCAFLGPLAGGAVSFTFARAA